MGSVASPVLFSHVQIHVNDMFILNLPCVHLCFGHSDSEMEIEAEHYTNGVVEGSSARIMNGTYKHEEILQPDDNSIGNGVTGTHTLSFSVLTFYLDHLYDLCHTHTHATYVYICFHTYTSTVCVPMCCQKMRVVTVADSSVEGTRQPQRG